MSVTVDFSEVFQGINALEEHLDNPAPVLRKFSKGYRASVKATIAAGGIGSKPYAESTQKRLESTGTSLVSARGTIRVDRRKRVQSAIKRNAKVLDRDGWSPDWQKKQDRLSKRLDSLEKAESRAAKKKGARDIGKRQSERNQHPLQNMGKTIRASAKNDTLRVYSAADMVGKAQDEGAGKGGKKRSVTPDRPYIKTPDFDQQVQRLAHMFEQDLEEAFDGS